VQTYCEIFFLHWNAIDGMLPASQKVLELPPISSRRRLCSVLGTPRADCLDQ